MREREGCEWPLSRPALECPTLPLAAHALAQAVGSQVEQFYARSDVLERRREVMEAWAAFLVV